LIIPSGLPESRRCGPRRARCSPCCSRWTDG
jgi:hypothetical protein